MGQELKVTRDLWLVFELRSVLWNWAFNLWMIITPVDSVRIELSCWSTSNLWPDNWRTGYWPCKNTPGVILLLAIFHLRKQIHSRYFKQKRCNNIWGLRNCSKGHRGKSRGWPLDFTTVSQRSHPVVRDWVEALLLSSFAYVLWHVTGRIQKPLKDQQFLPRLTVTWRGGRRMNSDSLLSPKSSARVFH